MRAVALVLVAAVACKSGAPAAGPVAAAGRPAAMSRLEWNQLAARLNLPVFWAGDRDEDGVPDPDEVTGLLFYPASAEWVRPDAAQLAQVRPAAPPAGLSPEETERRRLVQLELDQGAPALVRTDLTGATPGERQFVLHILAAAGHIDGLYATMLGARALEPQLPEGDVASASLFRRNWGPRCVAPKTAQEPNCSALPSAPTLVSDLYPADLQTDPKFCAALEARPDAAKLMAPFVAVRRQGGELVPVPYNVAYREPMAAVARELRAAAAALASEPGEAALRAYLEAAATGFESNDWGPADEAWSRMNATNSKWYLRVAPDETYWEPCSQKAGFAVTFARINRDSLRWQEKLTPLQQKMEDRLAALIGKPYTARKVSFHLPDFIDIVVNAGDARDPFGATVGQSLPNWGKVAEESRGRTMAMTNLYTDPDSLAMRRLQAESLLSAESMGAYSDGTEASLVGTIVHEAAHNLGPAQGYLVGGKGDGEVFGGQLATILEELKAQSAALFFIGDLVEAGALDAAGARQAWTDAFIWALGHISRGMTDDSGRPRPYSQLAAIQVGFLMDEGAITFDAAAAAANGKDRGAFTLHLDRFPAAVEKLMKQVGRIKSTGDRAGGEALVEAYVRGKVVPIALIGERFTRFPKQSFVYAIDR